MSLGKLLNLLFYLPINLHYSFSPTLYVSPILSFFYLFIIKILYLNKTNTYVSVKLIQMNYLCFIVILNTLLCCHYGIVFVSKFAILPTSETL